MKHKFAYKLTLKDADFTKDKGKVFSCFACGVDTNEEEPEFYRYWED